jgi:hypothetical protein
MAVFAEMAWMERRPELGLLCRTARSNDHRLTEAAVQAVLPGLGDAGARNVIAWCALLGLIDRGRGLTGQGLQVAETDEAPVPEQGVYDLWCAEHPLIGRRILAAERLASTREPRFEQIVALPIEPDRGVVFRSVANPRERFMLRDLPTNHGQAGCLLGSTRATCRICWTLDFSAERDHWQLEGTIEGHQGGLRAVEHKSEVAAIDLRALADDWGVGPLAAVGRWQPSERRLAVTFSGRTDAEQDSFRMTVKLAGVSVPRLGSYSDVTLEDVPIGPTSPTEAQRWAAARLDRHMQQHPAYRSRGEVRRLFAELSENTPLERFGPTLPAHEDLARGYLATKRLDLFWSVAAAVDLAPRPLLAEELEPLRVGTATIEQVQEVRDVVNVPYRAGWSMRRVVERLLAGSSPRKVLLCDRYVRGAENLASLKLMVLALRQANPATVVEVWTATADAELKLIQAVTGQRPRTYQETFGRSTPHDRFFLVLPEGGAGFGWQMSNSPLDARADIPTASPETPLRSRGLVAVRMSPEQLPERLAQWFDGGGR